MAVKFLPIQEGTGDPSPTNVRPITAPLTITGIGEVYGGTFDTRTGVLTETWAHIALDGTDGISASQYHYLGMPINGYAHLDTTIDGMCSWCLFKTNNANPPVLSQGNSTATMWLWLPNDSPLYDDADAFKSMCADLYEAGTPFEYAYETTNTTAHTLTPSQYAEACAQLNIPAASKELLMRRRNLATPHTATATGDIASFSTDMAAKLKECKCEFEPVQSGSGDPSPTNVRPISGWTGAKVSRTGKNIIYPTYESRTQNNVTFTVNSDGSITTTTDGTASASAYAAPNLSSDPSKMQLIPAGPADRRNKQFGIRVSGR